MDVVIKPPRRARSGSLPRIDGGGEKKDRTDEEKKRRIALKGKKSVGTN